MVHAIGECLYDLTFRSFYQVDACPGGSMLNSAVSLARSNIPVTFYSEAGNDQAGELLVSFLRSEGIETQPVHLYPGKTSLAVAFLDDHGDASYSFYQEKPEEAPVFQALDSNAGDVMLFGSSYALQLRNQENIRKLAKSIKERNGWVIYDPNFRKTAGCTKLIHEVVNDNIAISDIVRGSDQDFFNLFGVFDGKSAYEKVRSAGADYLIYTRNNKGVDLFTPEFEKHYDSIQVQVVSTIGAGDNFNAGLISILHGKKQNQLSEKFWDQAIAQAIIFATEVCASTANFVARKRP